MTKTLGIYGITLVASMAFIGMPGCSKKSVQSGGDSQATQGMAKGGSVGSSDSSKSGVGSFPDTSLQSGGGGLQGINKNPS